MSHFPTNPHDEIQQLKQEKNDLLAALLRIKIRAYNEEPCEEIEDAQRDLRHVYALASSALDKVKP